MPQDEKSTPPQTINVGGYEHKLEDLKKKFDKKVR